MKKALTLLLVFALVLSMVTGAFAAESTENGEQPKNQVEQTTVTVGTLTELKEAIAAAEDGDTIAISAEIILDNDTLATEKSIILTRADTYETGALLSMRLGASISGFNIIDGKSIAVSCESCSTLSVSITDCDFQGDAQNTNTFVNVYGDLNGQNIVRISNCTFDGTTNHAISCRENSIVTLLDCVFENNAAWEQGGAIYSSGTLILERCHIQNNHAMSGGGVYCRGNLTITDCEIGSNTIDNPKFGTDILSLGVLTITDEQEDGAGFYDESTGEKITLPLTDYADTAKLIYLTDDDAATYFTPEEPPETPSEPPEQPDDPEPTIIYRNVYVRVPVYIEKEPEPVEPALVCGDAVIDVSRSVKLDGYDDGLLHLEDGLTRAQFAKILCGLLDADTLDRYKTADTIFDDVAPDVWYCPYVNTIAAAGIVCGTGNGNFDPEGILTWGHIITVLSRFVEAQDYTLQNIQYDGWALDSVKTAVALGWIADHAAFNPDAAISRGELAYFVNYVLGLYR